MASLPEANKPLTGGMPPTDTVLLTVEAPSTVADPFELRTPTAAVPLEAEATDRLYTTWLPQVCKLPGGLPPPSRDRHCV